MEAANTIYEEQWVQLLDESSNKYYYANVATEETTWEPPASFVKFEEINATFSNSVDDTVIENHRPAELTDDILIDKEHSHISSQQEEMPQKEPSTVDHDDNAPVIIPCPVYTSLPAEKIKQKLISSRENSRDAENHPLYGYAKSNYNLAINRSFRGIKVSSLDAKLRWEKDLLTTPLTYLPKDHVKTALQVFRNISGFMGNRSSGKGQMDHCFKLLRTVMTKSVDIKDEVYCQLCKQMTANPNEKAVLNGWHLMHACLVTFQPSKELTPYLERFFSENVGSMNRDIALYTGECLFSLQNAVKKGERKEIPSLREIAAMKNHAPISMKVSLIDGTEVEVAVNAWTTCGELSDTVAEKLGIHEKHAFALFEVSIDDEERLLETEERILDLCALWERLTVENNNMSKSKKQNEIESNGGYSLMYKVYLFLNFDDEMVEEINLLYHQAIHDITHGVLVCPLEHCIQLGAYQLQVRHGSRKEIKRIDLMDSIHEYIPRNLVSLKNKGDIVKKVLDRYATLTDRSAQQVKLAYLRVCEKLKLYGSTFFAVQNTRNRKMPQDVALAVSYKGISIVSGENESILAQHFYVDIASWGYSSNAFVFVVVHDGEEQENVFKTNLGKSLNDLVATYVKYIITSTTLPRIIE